MKIYEKDLNFFGKIPLIQQVSGTCRILYGASKIADPNKHEKYIEIQKDILRGLIEMIPIISTVALSLFDFLNQYYIQIEINKPKSPFKISIEIWKAFPSQKHLFDIFEKGQFLKRVDKEENPHYGYMHLTKHFGFFRKAALANRI